MTPGHARKNLKNSQVKHSGPGLFSFFIFLRKDKTSFFVMGPSRVIDSFSLNFGKLQAFSLSLISLKSTYCSLFWYKF